MAPLLSKLTGFAAKGWAGGDPIKNWLHHLGKEFTADVGVLWLLRLRKNHAASLEIAMVPSAVPEQEFFLSVGEIPVVLGEDAAFSE